MKKGLGLVIIFIALLSLSNFVIAKGTRSFSGEVGLASNGAAALNMLALDVPTGMIDINVVDGEVVRYQVDVEDKSNNWFLFATDLESLVLTEQIIDQVLYLNIDEKGVTQKWTLEVPRDLALQLNIGVGSIDLDSFSQSLSADIGVGSAWVGIASADYHHVRAAVGVGEIQAQGFEQGSLQQERVIVSDQLTYNGTGTHNIDIKIGVGDVNLSQDLINKRG
ncbi:hypothetical protein MD588_11440 [Photobacterium sp. SDRW27]|uniref:hypothetical protein n=1 Tax=Photobacterium obscurum TaxID=2829490 RepID=UPI0022435EAE|nr:hypothetical protein [Photobacterium obscurum]MCW8329421.1 hypothetical protein [Photobacterium obscurum]